MPPPTLFDDQGEPPDDGRAESTSTTIGADAASTAPAPDGSDTAPNYLVRRAIVVALVVGLVAVVAVVVGQLIGSGDDDTTSGAASGDWNRIVLVNDRTGQVIVSDEAGEEAGRIDTGLRTVADSEVVQATAMLVSADGTVVADLGDETFTTIELNAETIVAPSGTTLTMIAPDETGGRGVLVHGPSADTIDTDAFATIAGADYEFDAALSDTSGRHVLLTDSGNFQSVLFSFDRADPSFFAGLALAIDDATVVTAQNVGSDATVSIFDHAGDPMASGRTPSVRAAMLAGGTVYLVTVDGQIIAMDTGTGDAESGDQLDIGTVESGVVMTTGDRLVVTGSDGTAIIGDDGTIVGEFPDAAPYRDERALSGATCITLVRMVPADGVVVVDTSDGTTVADEAIAADTVMRSADGCTIAVPLENGFDVVAADGVTSVADDVLVAFAPDGSNAVVERERRLVLIAVDPIEDDDPIDLGAQGRTATFTES